MDEREQLPCEEPGPGERPLLCFVPETAGKEMSDADDLSAYKEWLRHVRAVLQERAMLSKEAIDAILEKLLADEDELGGDPCSLGQLKRLVLSAESIAEMEALEMQLQVEPRGAKEFSGPIDPVLKREFLTLYKVLEDELRRAFRRTGIWDGFDDSVQTAGLKLWMQMRRDFNDTSPIRDRAAYLGTVARNIAEWTFREYAEEQTSRRERFAPKPHEFLETISQGKESIEEGNCYEDESYRPELRHPKLRRDCVLLMVQSIASHKKGVVWKEVAELVLLLLQLKPLKADSIPPIVSKLQEEIRQKPERLQKKYGLPPRTRRPARPDPG